MEKPLLSDIEDDALAMAEDEYVSFKLASYVLRRWHARGVTYGELMSITGRLSSLGLIRWRVKLGRRTYFRSHAHWPTQVCGDAQFTATPAGLAYLQAPRPVA